MNSTAVKERTHAGSEGDGGARSGRIPVSLVVRRNRLSRSEKIPITLPCQQPMGTGHGHFDEAKDHVSGNHATILVMSPGAERNLQGRSQQRSAVLAEQLLADLPNTPGESRSPIAIASHSDIHPLPSGDFEPRRCPQATGLDPSTRPRGVTQFPIIA